MQISQSLLQPPSVGAAPGERFRLLVVDDDANLRRAVIDLLASGDRRIVGCGSAAEAMRLIAAEPIDLVLLDLGLPDVPGLEVMRFIRASHPRVTTIVVSGDDRIDSAIATLQAGAREYVRKPFEPAALVRSVENALAARKLEWENGAMRVGLEHSERLHRYFVDNSPDLIFALDAQGKFRFLNERFVTLLGYDKHSLVGVHYSKLVAPDDLERAQWAFDLRRGEERASRNVEVRLRAASADSSADEATITVAVSALGIHAEARAQAGDREFLGTYCVARDISARVRAEQIVAFHAFHDSLTGLPNRSLFRDRLRHAIADARRRRKLIAVLFIDLDRFKLVNDTYGHLKGDQLLQQAASRLRRCLRESDTLSRIGGDEFVALVSDLDAREDARTAAGKIVRELDQPFVLGTEELRSSVSVGVATYPDDGANEEELIRNADLAMYLAKRRGKNGIAFFSPDLSTAHSDRLQLEGELRGAAGRSELELYFQPIHNVRSGCVERLEALLRWRHPVHGMLAPGRFISIAEESGQIGELGEFVLESACAHLARWHALGYRGLGISLNLSPRDFDRSDLVERVIGAAQRHGLPPEALELEITENVLIEDMDAVAKRALRLRGEGVRIAIDDFGTRYSLLGYLQSLPISAIKIDQSFVRDLGTRSSSDSIVGAMVGIARSLGLDIVAEGVERSEHLALLKELGCEVMQGYWFSRPLPGAEVEAYLARNRVPLTCSP